MVGSTWTNPDQVVFLNDRLIDFVEAQNGKTLTAFWTTIVRDFFLQWPTPDSELVPNGLDPNWNGTQKTSKKKKKSQKTEETVTPEEKVNSTVDTSKWVGLRREVSLQLMILNQSAYIHLRASKIGPITTVLTKESDGQSRWLMAHDKSSRMALLMYTRCSRFSFPPILA
jgi:hypothetical protein